MSVGAATAAANRQSIDLQNKKVSKTFSMQNLGEGEREGAQISHAGGSMEKGRVGRRIVDSSKSVAESQQLHEDS